MEASPHRPSHEDAHTTLQPLLDPPPQQQGSARKARAERPAASPRYTPREIPEYFRPTPYIPYMWPRIPSPPSPWRKSSPRRRGRYTDTPWPSPSIWDSRTEEALEWRRGIFDAPTPPVSSSTAQPTLKRKGKYSNLTAPSKRLALSSVIPADDDDEANTPSTTDAAAPLLYDHLLSPAQSSTASTAQTTSATIHRTTTPPPLVAGQYQEVELPFTGEGDAAGSMADSRQERGLDVDLSGEGDAVSDGDEDQLHLDDEDAELHQEVDPAAEETTTGLDDEDAGLYQKEDLVVEKTTDLAENADRDFHQGKRSVVKPDTGLDDKDAALHQEANSPRRGKESGVFQLRGYASANQAEAIAALRKEPSRCFLADTSATSNIGRTMSEDFRRKRSKFKRDHGSTQRAQSQRAQSLDSGTIHPPQEQSKPHRDIPRPEERGKNYRITLTLVECLVICLYVVDVLGSIVSGNLYLAGCFFHRHYRFHGCSRAVRHEEPVFHLSVPIADSFPTTTMDSINDIRSPWIPISIQEPSSIGTVELAQRLNTVMSTHRGLLKMQHQVQDMSEDALARQYRSLQQMDLTVENLLVLHGAGLDNDGSAATRREEIRAQLLRLLDPLSLWGSEGGSGVVKGVNRHVREYLRFVSCWEG